MVGGKRPLPRTFQRSRWGQNSKLRWQSSTGPPLPSLALQAKKRSRWRHQAAGDQSTSSNSSSSFTQNVSLSQIDHTFVRQLSSLLLQLRTVTAHVRALWVWPRQHQILHVGYSHKTSNTVFLIYDYCVSVTNIAGVCKSIHRELGGRLGLEKPQKGEGGGFARAGG